MNLAATIEIYAGGAGSGCNPEAAKAKGTRCGRPPGEAKDIARHANKQGGFTYNVKKHGYAPLAGYALSIIKGQEKKYHVKAISPNQIQAYIDTHQKALASDPRAHVGGWYDSTSGDFYLDVSVIEPDLKKAMTLAEQHNQLAIYDLGQGKTISTKHAKAVHAAADVERNGVEQNGKIYFHFKPGATAQQIYDGLMEVHNKFGKTE